MMLEEEVKLYRFAGISPEQSFTEAGRHREAVVAADQSMVIGCFGDDLSVFVDDDFHALPPVQRPLSATAMLRDLSNLAPAPAFQCRRARISYCRAPHRAARDLHTNERSSKGSFTLIYGTPELAIAKGSLRVENQTAAAGGQTEMSDGCGRLALRECEENSPRPSGPCRPAG